MSLNREAPPGFKIAAAQVASVRGDVEHNIAIHAAAMATAARHEVSVLVFPELSLTGYEPDLAASLAMAPGDPRLEPLGELAARHGIQAIVGAPLQNGRHKPTLGAIVLSGRHPPRTYDKMHLGGDEPAFFTPGEKHLVLSVLGHRMGIAICADASQASHPEGYTALGADIYAVGVFLTSQWYETDVPRLAAHAARFGMLTVMSNQADSQGTHRSIGKSAMWEPGGALLVQACDAQSALLIASHTVDGWRSEVVGL